MPSLLLPEEWQKTIIEEERLRRTWRESFSSIDDGFYDYKPFRSKHSFELVGVGHGANWRMRLSNMQTTTAANLVNLGMRVLPSSLI
jgi:hypothetical protein